MKQKNILKLIVGGLLFFFLSNDASAQTVQKIGKEAFNIDVNAVLELQSDVKGFLPPRMTTANAGLLGDKLSTTLGIGMIIFITDEPIPGLRVWSATGKSVKTTTSAVTTPGSEADAFDTFVLSPGWTSFEDSANKSSYTSLTSNGSSTGTATDLLYPTQLAVKTYVDKEIAVVNAANTKTVVSKSASYIIDAGNTNDYTILCTGVMTLTLPNVTTTNSGRILVIRKVDTNNSVLTFAGGLIKLDGTTISSLNYGKTIRVQSNGIASTGEWVVID